MSNPKKPPHEELIAAAMAADAILGVDWKGDIASHEERLTDAMAAGVIFGLNWRGDIAWLDPKHDVDFDGPDPSWWGSQKWSDDERKTFRRWLSDKIKSAAHHVILGSPGEFDEINGISNATTEEREDWYRRNVFDDPSAICWPAKGLPISDAVMASRKDATDRTPEEDQADLARLHSKLKHGLVVASGEQRRPGGTRILIPIIEFETLRLRWDEEVIADGYGLTYYAARIHQLDALPPQFKNAAKKYEGQYRRRNKLDGGQATDTAADDPDQAKLVWKAKDWLSDAVDKDQRLRDKLLADSKYVGAYVWEYIYTPWFKRMAGIGRLALDSSLAKKTFTNAAAKPLNS